MRKKLDLRKLQPRQLVFFFGGLALAVTGLVLSVILFASSLYTVAADYPFDLNLETRQDLCEVCDIADDQSLWLGLPNRQIEYTDISIEVYIGPNGQTAVPSSSTSFVLVGLRNQYGGQVYYSLQSLGDFAGQSIAISVQRSGSDRLDLPASIAIRTYQGIALDPIYVGLMVVGLVLIGMAFRRSKPGNA